MTVPSPARPPRWPLLLLGLMTAFTLGGPLVFGYTLRGGDRPNWPPDRPVEWFVLGAISAMVLILMMGCLSLARVTRRAIKPDRTGVEP